MPRTLPFAVAIVTMLMSSSAAQPQGTSTLRPSTDQSVTTGIGTGSSFRNVRPPPGEPPVENTRPFYWDTPEANEKPVREQGGKASAEPDKAPAEPGATKEPPAEDPRTMITRDRIVSPQH